MKSGGLALMSSNVDTGQKCRAIIAGFEPGFSA